MFGYDSKENLPVEIEYSYYAWDRYMSCVWNKLICFSGITSRDCLIEIAPGSSTKIGMALAKMTFSGQLYIVEPHPDLGNKILKIYQSILPSAKIVLITETLEKSLLKLPLYPDAILANHPLDDMLLAANTSKKSELFDSWKNTEKPATNFIRQEWKKLSSNQAALANASEFVTNTWKAVYNQLKPKWLLMSQYYSYTLDHDMLADLNHQAATLLHTLGDYFYQSCIPAKRLQAVLNSMPHYGHEHIGNNVLNAKFWLVVRQRCDQAG